MKSPTPNPLLSATVQIVGGRVVLVREVLFSSSSWDFVSLLIYDDVDDVHVPSQHFPLKASLPRALARQWSLSTLMLRYHICSRNGRYGSAGRRRRRKWQPKAV
jgi:hypothetical protein